MRNKPNYREDKINSERDQSSITINIENSEVLDIFGINNENLIFFENNLPIKIFQKGNQLKIQGSKKNISLLKNSISQTISDKKFDKKKYSNINLMQENLRIQMLNEKKNIKNINVTKTAKLDVIGKSKLQNSYLEILQKNKLHLQ